jgi:hypothetical protein
MGEDAERRENIPNEDEPEEATQAPGPGRPAGDVKPYGDEEPGDEPTNATGAPPIGSEEQRKGQTEHPAPDQDVGVPDDVGD